MCAKIAESKGLLEVSTGLVHYQLMCTLTIFFWSVSCRVECKGRRQTKARGCEGLATIKVIIAGASEHFIVKDGAIVGVK